MSEIWKQLPDPDYGLIYEVSNLGRVRSWHGGKGRILTGSTNKDGYPIMVLFDGRGGRKGFPLHRLVALAFHREGQSVLHNEVAHLDGDRKNARADNLKWVSKVENHAHKRLHGTHQAGEKHPRAKLTEANVIAIRHASQPYAALAERYGVSRHTIIDIRRGRRWGSVADESPVAESDLPKTSPAVGRED